MPITDLTGYTWTGNSSLTRPTGEGALVCSINFTSDNYNFETLGFPPTAFSNTMYYSNSGTTITVYNFNTGSWASGVFKTIQITGGTDATNATLISWLEANGTLTAPQPSVVQPASFNEVSVVEHNEYITLNINGVDFNLETISQPSGYSITVNLEMSGSDELTIYIYDGQNSSGALAYEGLLTRGESISTTVNITSGYMYITNNMTYKYNIESMSSSGGVTSTNPSIITGNGTFYAGITKV